MSKKAILIILDGWGESENNLASAIFHAKTPFMDYLIKNYPKAVLRTDGLHVGLPKGQMGNSEVGHMNIGAGRIVYQDLIKINKSVENGSFFKDKTLLDSFKYAKQNNKIVHILGLLSNGGVHSHMDHAVALCKMAFTSFGISPLVHAFTDGRDTSFKSGASFIEEFESKVAPYKSKIASIIGRYYAMDRDERWERIKLAYDLIVHSKGEKYISALDAVRKSYKLGVTDEFIKPIVITNQENKPLGKIQNGDVVVFFNFRTDRGRELTRVLSQEPFQRHKMKPLNLHFTTMTTYNSDFKNINVVYPKKNISKTLGEILETHNKSQIRIAETEKYPHVTFFFSGGREKEFKGERRILCPSAKVATYDLKPDMSAYDIRDAIIPEIENERADFICLNFANSDMVGHTGVMEATVEAVQAVDSCLSSIIPRALKHKYSSLIISDHGNSEFMIKEDGSPHTSHTTNPVPFILVDQEKLSIKNGILADISPTILDLMKIDKPIEMTGNSLIL